MNPGDLVRGKIFGTIGIVLRVFRSEPGMASPFTAKVCWSCGDINDSTCDMLEIING